MTAEQIFDIAKPFGSFEYGDAQGDKRLGFARAIEAAATATLLERIAALEAKPEQAAQPERKPLSEAGLTFQQADAAAKVLAERMDYPWSQMPQQGRDKMREIAQAVIEAANGIAASPNPKD